MRYHIHLVLWAVMIGLLVSCSSRHHEEKDPYAGIEQGILYERGMTSMKKGYYTEAVDIFESFESQYPLSNRSEDVLMNYVYAQYMKGEHALAVASADRFLRLYPRSRYADYVLYLKGIANTEHSRNELDRYLPMDIALRDTVYLDAAYSDFQTLIKRYPNSKYASDAEQRMILIRNTLAKKELTIAKHYFVRENFVGASNRALYILRHYPQSPQVEAALEMYIQSQQALGLAGSKEDALRILQLNFPQSKWLRSL